MPEKLSSQRLAWIEQSLEQLQHRGLRRHPRVFAGQQTAVLQLDGQPVVNFGSNDYLALAADSRLRSAAAAATQQYGWGSGASPLVTGLRPPHRRLQQALSHFKRTPAALLFPSGFAANTGTIPALVTTGDAVFSDRLNHASIIDGCRLSRADVHVYDHADLQDLERRLAATGPYRRRLIVTDGLFSMTGDFAPLDGLADIADRYDAMLMVDEAHGTGVVGQSGQGVAQWYGVADRVDVHVGTLSKALGSSGGFVCGSIDLVEWLTNCARPYFFSTAPPAAASAAAIEALHIVGSEPRRRRQLAARATELREALAAQGWQTGGAAAQIIPIVVGDPARAAWLSDALRQRGFFVPFIRPPSVPEGQTLLRISLCYGHSVEAIRALLDALGSLRGGRPD